MALGVALLGWAVVWQLSFVVATGFVALHLIGAHSDYVRDGIIDEVRERELFAAERARNPLYIPERSLLGPTMSRVELHGIAMTIALMGFGIVLIVLSWRVRGSRHDRAGRSNSRTGERGAGTGRVP